MGDFYKENSEALHGLTIASEDDDDNTSAGVCSDNMENYDLSNPEKAINQNNENTTEKDFQDFYQKNFYQDNPETLYIIPDCRLEIELRPTEDCKEFGCEYKVLNVDDFPLLDNHPMQAEMKGWLSPRRKVTLPEEEREEAGIPREAQWFTYLYPPHDLAEYIDWKKTISQKSNKSAFLYIASFGGYVYFGKNSKVLCVNAISCVKSKYKLNFQGPFEASKSSYRKISGLNLYQDLYIDCFREVGFIGSAWIDPGEDKFIDTEVEGQSLIKNKHGGFILSA